MAPVTRRASPRAMTFRRAVLVHPGRPFDDGVVPRTLTVGHHSVKTIELIQGGLLVTANDGRSFWTPLSNIIYAEPT